jgi:hypothetical protein
MNQSPPAVHNPDATLAAQQTMGFCNVVTDARVRGDEVVCGEPAIDEILVKNSFGLFVVPTCRVHRKEHREFYDALRSQRGRRVRRSGV